MLDSTALIKHCLAYNQAYEDYPFGIEWTVMRHSENKKTFAYIYERAGSLYINLKCEPMRADFLRRVYPAVTAGFHMDKTHWNTVLMDDSIPEEEFFPMITHSYELIKPKMRR